MQLSKSENIEFAEANGLNSAQPYQKRPVNKRVSKQKLFNQDASPLHTPRAHHDTQVVARPPYFLPPCSSQAAKSPSPSPPASASSPPPTQRPQIRHANAPQSSSSQPSCSSPATYCNSRPCARCSSPCTRPRPPPSPSPTRYCRNISGNPRATEGAGSSTTSSWRRTSRGGGGRRWRMCSWCAGTWRCAGR